MKRDAFADEIDAALGEAALRYRRDHFAFERRQRLSAEARRFDAGVWAQMAGMGWLSVASDEADGGLGRRIGSIALLARHAGAAGINEPLLSAWVAAELLRVHGAAAQRARWLAPLIAGGLRIACAFDAPLALQGSRLTGRCEVVPDADIADLLLLQVQGQWHALAADAPGLRRSRYPLLDGRAAATLELQDCVAEALQPAADGDTPRWLCGLVAAADALGAMDTAFDLTLDYIKTRQQFGRALADNQVVVHRCVDMFLRLKEAQAVLDQACEALASGDVTRVGEVCAAKAFIPPQGRLLAQEAVQLHGGIGITEEYALSHCLRRVLVDEQLFGATGAFLQRFAGPAFTR
ncbi:MAG TPA: acyl-CoA dehydrogenase family protein [Rubrivivax sp.]|nr:acyl-CoA dehydrogenase family protein [Rubrivivax sp.]